MNEELNTMLKDIRKQDLLAYLDNVYRSVKMYMSLNNSMGKLEAASKEEILGVCAHLGEALIILKGMKKLPIPGAVPER